MTTLLKLGLFALFGLLGHLATAQQKPPSNTSTITPIGLAISLGQPVTIPLQSVAPEIVISSGSSNRKGYLLAAVYGWNAGQRRAEINAYLSTDYGLSWQHVLQDASTPWVSEISCAYGADGNAYVVTGASKRTGITRGHPYGQRHLYHSSDDGRTWHGPTTGPFVDWTCLVVDTTKRNNRGNVYVFGHDIATTNGSWTGPAKPLLVSKDRGATFDTPTFTGKWPTSGGGYPLAAHVLHDGQLVALYRRQNPGSYVVVSSQDGGRSTRELTAIPKDSLVQRIAALAASFGVDQSSARYDGRFYVAYPAIRNKLRVIMLARSDDKGLSWRNSVAATMPTNNMSNSDLGYVSLAINPVGVVGMSWSDPVTQVQYFSYSTNGGDDFSNATSLSPSQKNQWPTVAHIQDHLQTMGTYEPDVADSSMNGASSVGKGLSIRLIEAGLGRVQMSCDEQGSFHPIWFERQSDGQPVLLTRQVRVGLPKPVDRSSFPAQFVEVTNQVLIDIVNQHFDPVLNEFQLGFTVTNTSDSTFRDALRLRIRRLISGQGFDDPQVLDAVNGLTGQGAVLELDSQLIDGKLTSGQPTRPYIIRLRSRPRQSYESVWQQLRQGQTPHPVSVEFDVFTKRLTPP